MQQKFCRERAALALLLACTMLAATVAAADVDIDEFDDGVVEDVQEEAAVLSGEELVYESPVIDKSKFHFADHFDDIEASRKKWVKSQAKKDDTADEIAKYDGIWDWESPQRIVWPKDKGLVLKSKAKHAAISARLSKVFDFKGEKPLVVQYEVTMQEGQECGGSYIKLLSASKETEDLKTFNDKTPYTIMFGPDKCGNDVKMHFIFRHVNPINGTISEKHCNKPKNRLEEPFKDKLPHLYQLVVRPDNSFEIRLDHKIINEGSLLTDFKPAVNPPAEIDDPNDVKPVEWDEREKIPDPASQKPDDWNDDAQPQIPDVNAVMPNGWLEDEPDMIADPTAEKPDDWDTEIDGEWEAPLVDNPLCEKAPGCGKWKPPLINNPEYKGKWRAPMIENPNYQGKWAPRKIVNPDFFEDLTPFKMSPINAVGIELWSMSNEILFDNLIITDNVDVARDFAANSFDIKRRYIDRESKTVWHRLMRHMNYKPGWWALYFLYLLVPASCYVFYLYRRAKEDSFVNKVVELTKAYPTVWAIGLVIIIALTIIGIYYKFGKTKKDSTEKAAAAQAKKTDAPQPDDDNAAAADEDEEGSEEDADSTAAQAAAESSKTDSPKSVSPNNTKKSDLDINEQEDNNEDPTQTEEATTKSARKRTVRKD